MKGAIIMPVKSKATADEKIRIAQLYLSGKLSQGEASRQAGVSKTTIQSWISKYEFQGELGFKAQEHNSHYSVELKQAAVREYLNGGGSQQTIAEKYGLRSKHQLTKWIKMYNNGEDFSHKMSGGSCMKTSRDTTFDERVKIAKECLANGKNYGETAIKYNVSYQQVYGWVKRYIELGEAGLEDRRGRRKKAQEPRSKEEELQIENAQLKHELQMVKMERDLLKKVSELERKDRYRR